MIIAGIDPSLTRTGLAVIRSAERVETTTVTSKPPKTGTETLRSRYERMEAIAADVLETIYGAELVGIESPAYGMRHAGKVHDRSGLWWRIVAAMEGRGVPVVEVPPPSRMMYATGKGNAGKDLVLVTTAATYKQAEITGNDVADAVVIAAMVSRLAGQPIELRQPAQAKLKALAKVNMPDPLITPPCPAGQPRLAHGSGDRLQREQAVAHRLRSKARDARGVADRGASASAADPER